MKFAKYLDSDAVPEWKKKYIAYKTLKKVIKSIAREIENGNEDTTPILMAQPEKLAVAGESGNPPIIRQAVLNVTCGSDGTVIISPTSAPIYGSGTNVRVSTSERASVDDFDVAYKVAHEPSKSYQSAEETETLQFCCRVDDVSCFTDAIKGDSPLQSRFQLILAAEAKKINQFYREQEYQAEVNLGRIKELAALYLRDNCANDLPQMKRRKSSQNVSLAVADTNVFSGDCVSVNKEDPCASSAPSARQSFSIGAGSSPSLSPDNELETLELDMKTASHVEELLRQPEAGSESRPLSRKSSFDKGRSQSSPINISQARWPNNFWNTAKSLWDPQPKSSKEAQVLKKALQELYRTLELLKNYRILNFTGFVKILKKFDKAISTKLQAQLHDKLERLYFYASPKLKEMLEEIEQLYTQLTGRKLQEAKNELQIPVSLYNKDTEWSLWRSGVLSGITLALSVLTLRVYFLNTGNNSLTDKHILELFGALFLPLLFAYYIVVNVYVYRRYRINYVFIFELSPRQHLSLPELLSWVSHMGLLFSLSFYIGFQPIFGISSSACPMIFLVVIILYLANPLAVLHRKSRYWLVVTLYRLVTSGVRSVEFRDFFTGDGVNSLGFTLSRMQLFVCSYTQGFSASCHTANWAAGILQTLPPFWRAVQCARQFRDSKFTNYVNLANFGKYFVTIVASLVYSAWRMAPVETGWTFAWVTTAIISMLYNLFWDLYCDWGLLRIVPFQQALGRRKQPLAAKGAANPQSPTELPPDNQQVIRNVTLNDLHSLVTANHGQLYGPTQVRSRTASKKQPNNFVTSGPFDISSTSVFASYDANDPVNGPLTKYDGEAFKSRLREPAGLSTFGRAKFRLFCVKTMLNQNKYFLRDAIAYPSIWVYYLAMVLDTLMRLQWLLPYYYYKTPNGHAALFVQALIEITRRGMWNFFRMENEHLNNCGRFRAVRDIPLLLDDWKGQRGGEDHGTDKHAKLTNSLNLKKQTRSQDENVCPPKSKKKTSWATFSPNAEASGKPAAGKSNSEHELYQYDLSNKV